MREIMVRYRVKPDRVAENEALVRAVYEELHRAEPGGFRYATFKLDDGVSFLHLALQEDDAGPGPLPGLAAFRAFQEGIRDRCDELPKVTQLEHVGLYK